MDLKIQTTVDSFDSKPNKEQERIRKMKWSVEVESEEEINEVVSL
jgi:hypothetical protein